MSHEAPPQAERLRGPFGWALTVDVEEWYHSCLVPEYVDAQRRPALPEELDRWLAEWPAALAATGARATFFVLGEVAHRLPQRVREVAALGHEVASHGFWHRRADDVDPPRFLDELLGAKRALEDLLGAPVLGYRAPEWSLRRLENPRLRRVADAGFAYDSSLSRAWGVGHRANPDSPALLRWSDGVNLLEVPPVLLQARFRVPLGGWPARIRPVASLERALEAVAGRGACPLLVVHPWEMTNRPLPGDLAGWARFVHDVGRQGFGAKVDALLRGHRWLPIRQAVEITGPLPPVIPSIRP